jgi:hypothetical protein
MKTVVPLTTELPRRIYDRYAFPPSPEDDAILRTRLRLAATNLALDLRTRERLIPFAASMSYATIEAAFRSDLELCAAWAS